MTQEEMAHAQGVSVSTIRNWESGKAFPPYTRLAHVAKVYGVSLSKLAGLIATAASAA